MISFQNLQQGTETYAEGERLFRRGNVSFSEAQEDALLYQVGNPVQTVRLLKRDYAECSCGKEGVCEHIVAACLKAQEDGHLSGFHLETEQVLGEKMLLALNRAMPGSENIRLVPVLRLEADGKVLLGLSIGQERMYAVRNIAELLTCYSLGAPLVLSDKFTYQPSYMLFSKEDERLLLLLMNHISVLADTLREWEDMRLLGTLSNPEKQKTVRTEGRFVVLQDAFLQSVLRYFETHSFVVLTEDEKISQNGIRTADLLLCFMISSSANRLIVQTHGLEDVRTITPDARYVLTDGKLLRLHSAQARICRLLCREGFRFSFPMSDAEDTLATLLPSLSTVGKVQPSSDLAARLIDRPFHAAAYLDLAGSNVQARLEFHYGDIVIDPFAERDAQAQTVDSRLLLRDGRKEAALLSFFSDAGFIVRGGKILLRHSKEILSFCTQGVAELNKLCDVYASTDFEKVKPRRLSAKASFHMRGGRLIFELLEDGKPVEEIVPVLQAIVQRQQYVRLKTGEFLDVRDLNALAPVAQEMLDAARLDDENLSADARELSFGSYRAAYMISMLRLAGADTATDAAVDRAVASLSQESDADLHYVPEHLCKKLAPYQQRGTGWLLSLYEARMGGILADEMGLGKTVQVIAALSAAKHKEGTQKSIIVTPTSLSYHWLAELKRFDNSLVVRLINGARGERRDAIADIKADETVDVILISYPLLRRDIDFIREIPLRFAVLDEAQSVKNAQSQGAMAAKELNAQVRIALTGTPMENHTGELWSIFDFVLPGYLGTQAAFLRRYGGNENSEELRDRIRPFLMRRLKSEVLKDLPQKHETSLYAAMSPEQEEVYNNLLATLRLHVGKALDDGSLPKARMQVLSLLLKLRQVCCHPKLFLDSYDGTSGKLELLVQTVHTACENGHRMLIFSQFVGMLKIIGSRLATEGITPLYLDGDTKPETRQELCNRFNAGEGKVFLISLKAGGTGLNLTGADLVIHYDPWWNPAAEDQATDRAHRIGQTKDVDVIRLITQGSIEEKVTDLSRRKRAVFERVILAGETELSSLTEEDIRSLFFT